MTDKSLPSGFSVARFEHEKFGDDRIVFTFPRTGGRLPGSAVLKANDAHKLRTVKDALQGSGCALPDNWAIEPLARSLMDHIPDEAGLMAAKPGWKTVGDTPCFVMPYRAFGSPEGTVWFDPGSADIGAEIKGTLEEWKSSVAEPAVDAPAAAMAIMAALACPLLRFSTLTETFILNIAGESSSGKSTANKAGWSVWGNDEHLPKWNATERRMYEDAERRNDLPLVLDDVEVSDKDPEKRMKIISERLHRLANGGGADYSKVVSGENQLEPIAFRCIVLSSSPVSVVDHEMKKGTLGTPGDRVRLLELKVPEGTDGGIWHESGSGAYESTAERTDQFLEAMRASHGAAGEAWIRYLVEHEAKLAKRVGIYIRKFEKLFKYGSSLEHRIAKKIGLLFAAGMIARRAGIIPWDKNTITNICVMSYGAVIETAFPDIKIERDAVRRIFEHLRQVKNYYTVASGQVLKATTWVGQWYGKYRADKEHFVIPLRTFQQVCSDSTDPSAKLADRLLSQMRECGALDASVGKGWTKDVVTADGNRKALVLPKDQISKFLKGKDPSLSGEAKKARELARKRRNARA
ncbi:DUF927 domain-containing protein [Pelagibacterium montanilacus]|uniref:DUF927 domain-containing protein n=1 Tax=Pelagibacterium montanilacus TaxID=2185280 RepID=UPI0013E0D4CA|nr:DUF927 domain-containing protein [Pelagibacterium montanilacus]